MAAHADGFGVVVRDAHDDQIAGHDV